MRPWVMNCRPHCLIVGPVHPVILLGCAPYIAVVAVLPVLYDATFTTLRTYIRKQLRCHNVLRKKFLDPIGPEIKRYLHPLPCYIQIGFGRILNVYRLYYLYPIGAAGVGCIDPGPISISFGPDGIINLFVQFPVGGVEYSRSTVLG